jgi:sigma-B regulation protein RsbU (phosphoserine phosphatase)
MMPPGIDGFETCRRLKADPETRDIPVIFMSALDETEDKVRGLELGAVDYITKPFQAEEVVARVDTHLEIRRLRQDLARRNAELREANESMKADLVSAAEVQQSMQPRALREANRARFDWEYRPCQDIGGDSLGVFAFDDRHVGLYVLDVTGHGVPAALLSVSVTHALMVRDPDHSIVTRPGDVGESSIVAPAEVAGRLNRRFPMDESASRFFTLVYAVLDTREGRLRYAAAGHPGPLIVRADGTTEVHGATGPPIGIAEETAYEEREIQLGAGDRVLLYSDGAIEEANEERGPFGRERLESVLVETREAPLRTTLASIVEAIEAWSGASGFGDDVSLVAAGFAED